MRIMAASSFLSLDATALSGLVARRQLSCREWMQATLDRIAATNPVHNAIVALRDGDELLAQADACDVKLARGERSGWMDVATSGVEDLSDAAGLPTGVGSLATGRRVPAEDALFVQRMKQAGAIVIGKTITPAFGLGSHTSDNGYGM